MTDVRQEALQRLARCLWLDVEGVGPGHYKVTGGAEPHTVQKQPDGWRCDCIDYAVRGPGCKHTLAVKLRCGDERVIRALRFLAPASAPKQKVG